MGLDTSHDAWHGSYGSFGIWRNQLAAVAGYKIIKVDGFNSVDIDWSNFKPKNLAGEWDETPSDPLLVLIVHSDCDGSIYPAQAKPLITRMAAKLSYSSGRAIK